jgi:N-acyl-D-aspartate/D-glutamate deacylase
MHMRNYADHLVEAVDEALGVGAATGCRVQASHLCVVGQRNWGKTSEALAHMDQARTDGVRVQADIYPYLAGSANLSQLLPAWAHEGGTASMVERLHTSADRERIRLEQDVDGQGQERSNCGCCWRHSWHCSTSFHRSLPFRAFCPHPLPRTK